MRFSEQRNELAAALAKAQGLVRNAEKDRDNPGLKNKETGKVATYASLASMWEAARDALSKSGLAVMQDASNKGVEVTVVTYLLHESGQWAETEPLTLMASNGAVWSIGSAITYGKRYQLPGVVGMAPMDSEDDDGAVAQGPVHQPQPTKERRVLSNEELEFQNDVEVRCTECNTGTDFRDLSTALFMELGGLTGQPMSAQPEKVRTALEVVGKQCWRKTGAPVPRPPKQALQPGAEPVPHPLIPTREPGAEG